MNTSRTPLFLMSNLGAEVSRIISFGEKGETVSATRAQERAEKIIDDLRNFPEMKKRELEIGLLVRAIKSLRQSNGDVQVSHQAIRSYFSPFAVRLMAQARG